MQSELILRFVAEHLTSGTSAAGALLPPRALLS